LIELSLENYNRFAKNKRYSPCVEHNGAIYGFWLVGRWYNVTKGGKYYYGAYPPTYLARIHALFSITDKDLFQQPYKILHLFSGTVKGNGKNIITLDIKSELNPDVVGDAQKLSKYFSEDYFDLIIADPPYEDNYIKYGTKKFSRKKVLGECYKVLKKDGYLVWLDTILIQWSKKFWDLKGIIGLCQSTNHRIRAVAILRCKK